MIYLATLVCVRACVSVCVAYQREPALRHPEIDRRGTLSSDAENDGGGARLSLSRFVFVFFFFYNCDLSEPTIENHRVSYIDRYGTTMWES